jgi:hypothetical protein
MGKPEYPQGLPDKQKKGHTRQGQEKGGQGRLGYVPPLFFVVPVATKIIDINEIIWPDPEGPVL